MYKVFIQDRPIFFITEDEISNFNGIFVRASLDETYNAYILNLVPKLPEGMSVYVLCADPSEGIAAFFSGYDMVEAAGGIVKRKNKYLFIKRFGVWDLPKGKMEKGESPEYTAQREIEEECGIVDPKVKDLILITYHTYDYKGTPTIKKTYWYKMTYSGEKKVKPQEEEGITKVSWKGEDKLEKLMQNTYASIQDVLRTYFDK